MDIKYSDEEEEEQPLSNGSSRARNGARAGNNYDSDEDSLYGGRRGKRAAGGRGARGGRDIFCAFWSLPPLPLF